MHEILANLPPGAFVLDCGSGAGSFKADYSRYIAVRIDRDRLGLRPPHAAEADAAMLPFRANCFDAVIANHSLEHFDDLPGTLAEVGRVLKPTGSLYIGVPDASTISDRLYRWLSGGGGHVNPFTSAQDLATKIENAVALKHVATRVLCTSFAYLNRKNQRTQAARRIWLVGGGTELSLRLVNYFGSIADRLLRTRIRVYGWALYFGTVQSAIDCRTWTNVCIRCGSGYSSDWLRYQHGWVRHYLGIPFYNCPQCATANVFTNDTEYHYLP